MRITLHLEGTKEEIAEQCLAFVETLAGDAKPAKETKPAKKGKGKKDEEETFDLPENEDEESELPDDEENEEEAEEETEEAGTTLDDVIAAFRKFTTKDEANVAKAQKVLAKFGAKSVRKLDESDYDAAIAMLKKAK